MKPRNNRIKLRNARQCVTKIKKHQINFAGSMENVAILRVYVSLHKRCKNIIKEFFAQGKN